MTRSGESGCCQRRSTRSKASHSRLSADHAVKTPAAAPYTRQPCPQLSVSTPKTRVHAGCSGEVSVPAATTRQPAATSSPTTGNTIRRATRRPASSKHRVRIIRHMTGGPIHRQRRWSGVAKIPAEAADRSANPYQMAVKIGALKGMSRSGNHHQRVWRIGSRIRRTCSSGVRALVSHIAMLATPSVGHRTMDVSTFIRHLR